VAALIGALRVSLSADTAKFEQGMLRAKRQSQTSATAIQKSLGLIKAGFAGLISGLSVGLLANAIKGALDYAGSLGEVSQQLGVTTTDLQVFRYAAGQAGVSQEELDKALNKLTITMGQLRAGAEGPTKALNAVKDGLAGQVAAAENTGEAFRILADGLQGVENRSSRAAVEVAVLGRAGSKLDTVLSGGRAGVDNYAASAKNLGLVLGEDQIANADRTADKIEELNTALKANIAGAIANNSSAIYDMVSALVALIGKLGTALRAYQAFVAQMEVLGGRLQAFDPTNSAAGRSEGRLRIAAGESRLRDLRRQQAGGSSAEERAARLRRGLGIDAPAPKPAGNDIGRFLAPKGGGGGRPKKDRSAEEAERKRLEALREANQFDQEIRRAKIDVLQATRDLSTNEVERYAISVQIMDAEREAFAAQLKYDVAAKERTTVQADQLLLEYDRKDQLEREKAIAEEDQRAFEDSARLDAVTLELQRDAVSAELQNATTAKEQRDLQLRLLDLGYQIERARLEAVLADKQSSDAAKEEARRRLSVLPGMQAQDREGVVRGTQGPIEEYLDGIPDTADEWNEALENVAANGLKSVEDGIVDVLTGAKTVGEALQDILGDIIAQLIRLGVQKAIVAAIGGGGFGFAEGGYTGNIAPNRVAGFVHGREYVVNAKATRQFLPLLEAINTGKLPGMAAGGLAGLPIARVMPRRLNVDNDNNAGRGMGDMHFHFPASVSDREARRTGLQAAGAFRRAVARDAKVNG
jgi:hypothetical protein